MLGYSGENLSFCETCCKPRETILVTYDFASAAEDWPREYDLTICKECKDKDIAFNILTQFITGELK